MLLFWDFQHGPSKSEIILDKNLCLINILFKGRSASLQSKLKRENGMEIPDKEFCELIIYEKLSIEDPKKYPNPMDAPRNVTPDGGSCIISYSLISRKSVHSYTIQDCDCSDPFKYEFYYKGRF